MVSLTFVTSIAPAYAKPNSIFDPEFLQNHPQTYCNDIVGQNIQNDVFSLDQNDVHSRKSASNQSHNEYHSRTRNRGGKGGFGFGPFKINAGGQGQQNNVDKMARSSSHSSQSFRDQSFKRFDDNSSSTMVAVGKNCATFVEGAAAVEINETNSQVERMKLRFQPW